ncbi:hypothetical protein NEHOM01_1255 [Nematocida homosporus]|uniref:uncharacterized protein n=1 Tax=Nematocida homosporus TaxID=1912981 RepID=UPI00221F2AB9|nr:uncharacterized protein NEHOM01_1255 [Nematocida homosporus]KAI5186052.1 hypothetical protein NEHOM01_1255 [Nematocida homosporus]
MSYEPTQGSRNAKTDESVPLRKIGNIDTRRPVAAVVSNDLDLMSAREKRKRIHRTIITSTGTATWIIFCALAIVIVLKTSTVIKKNPLGLLGRSLSADEINSFTSQAYGIAFLFVVLMLGTCAFLAYKALHNTPSEPNEYRFGSFTNPISISMFIALLIGLAIFLLLAFGFPHLGAKVRFGVIACVLFILGVTGFSVILFSALFSIKRRFEQTRKISMCWTQIVITVTFMGLSLIALTWAICFMAISGVNWRILFDYVDGITIFRIKSG